jgi:NAD(P)H dehydrogenase (quinone)
VAEILTEISGRKISYVSPPVDEFKKTMADAGVPQEMAGLVAMFCEGIKQGEFDFPDPTLKQLLGREPESLAVFLKKVYG